MIYNAAEKDGFTAQHTAGTDDGPASFGYLQNAVFGYPG